jgi:hypothetical protein
MPREAPIDRLKKLHALAISSDSEEARTAAWKMAQLIDEHDLLDRLGGDPSVIDLPPEVRNAAKKVAGAVDLFTDLFGKAKRAADAGEVAGREARADRRSRRRRRH